MPSFPLFEYVEPKHKNIMQREHPYLNTWSTNISIQYIIKSNIKFLSIFTLNKIIQKRIKRNASTLRISMESILYIYMNIHISTYI